MLATAATGVVANPSSPWLKFGSCNRLKSNTLTLTGLRRKTAAGTDAGELVNQIARCLHQGRLLQKGTRVAFERLRAVID